MLTVRSTHTMAPRAYDSSRRRPDVEATRVRILEATRAIVGGKGDLTAFSMEAVARKAGVVRMTVYYHFQSRQKLLDGLSDHLAQQGGTRRMREVFLEPDVKKALRALTETFVSFWASDRLTLRRLRAMGVVAPASDRAPRNRDTWRREAIENLLSKMGKSPGGAKLREREDLVDLLTTLTSFETFDALGTGSRTPDAVAALLTRVALDLAGFD
ncbi:MAG: TetR/AcrR family transcriptional regulator [Thermoplasmata archaeon]|nr:TetR/AcrR family transcriptional regulator [Thermoplasmata archaeon]